MGSKDNQRIIFFYLYLSSNLAVSNVFENKAPSLMSKNFAEPHMQVSVQLVSNDRKTVITKSTINSPSISTESIYH
jgi:hypothetical protein